jgi:uncharacterized membrane protein YqjE
MPRSEEQTTRGLGALLHTVQGLLEELPGLVSDRVHLLVLELQRAGQSLGSMLVLGLAALVFGATAWVALWVGVAAAMVRAVGLHWVWALAIVLLLNAGAAAIAVVQALRLVRNLTLPATVRHLTRKSASAAGPYDTRHDDEPPG